MICSIDRCNNVAICRSWCGKHYARWKSSGDPLITRTGKEKGKRRNCVLDGCDRYLESASGLCAMHYKRWKRHGHTNVTQTKSGRYTNGEGYTLVLAPAHPNARADGYVLEHRRVMADYNNRPLSAEEIVHHINGDRKDNTLSNLQLLTRETHPTGHQHTCPACGHSFVGGKS